MREREREEGRKKDEVIQGNPPKHSIIAIIPVSNGNVGRHSTGKWELYILCTDKKIIKQKLHILPDLYTTETLNIVGYGVYTHTHTP